MAILWKFSLRNNRLLLFGKRVPPVKNRWIRHNLPDFIIDNEIVLDLKAKRIITKEDYFQMKRYLSASGKRLGLIVNFRQKYISPKRAPGKGALFSFEMKGAHAHDVATVIDRSGVAVRAGTHCAQPLLSRFGVTSTCRASFALYNTRAEVDALVAALDRAAHLFA